MAVIVAVAGIVAVAAVRDGDPGVPTLTSAPVVARTPAPIEPAAPTPTPEPTPEMLVVTAPPTPTQRPLADEATEVVLVGDSLAEGAAPALAQILEAAGLPLRVDARTGRGTAEGARALAGMAPQSGAVVVVVLGTNDAEDRSEAVRNARAVIESVPDGTPIRWIDVARADATIVNEVIAALAAIDPDTEVLAWSAVVADNPDLLVSDRIHFTTEGYATLAAYIATEALGLTLPAS